MKENSNLPLVSVIIPVKNEERNIGRCLESLSKVDWPKERMEIIIADAYSTDKTVQIAKKYGAKIVLNEKKTVAPGRNAAFNASRGKIVAFTDADCAVDKNWLKKSIVYFRDKIIAGVGGPNLTPEDESIFGIAVGWVFDQKLFAAGSLHARVLSEVVETNSLPGCNSIYKREILDKVMPQDETLLTCDETEMNYRIKDLGYKLLYTPDVFVYHYRRQTPKKLFWQMYRYAIGRVQFGKKKRGVVKLTHKLVGFSLPIFVSITFVLLLINIKYIALFCLLILGFLFWFFLKSTFDNKGILIGINSILGILIIVSAWSLGFLREMFVPLKDIKGR